MRRRRGRGWVWIVLVVVLSAAALVWAIRSFDLSAVSRIRWSYIPALLALSASAISVSALAAVAILRSLGHRAPIGQVGVIFLATLAANSASVAKLGIPLRIALFSRRLGIPLHAASAATFLEIAGPLLLSVVASLAGLVLFVDHLSGIVTGAVAACAAIALALWCPVRFADRVLAVLLRARPRWREAIVASLERFQRLLRAASMGRILLVIAMYGAVFALSAVRLFLISLALGETPSFLHVFLSARIAFVAGSLSMIPMGLGVRDASLGALLAISGISESAIPAILVIERVFSTGLPIVLGFVFSQILGVSWLRKRDEGNPQGHDPDTGAAT